MAASPNQTGMFKFNSKNIIIAILICLGIFVMSGMFNRTHAPVDHVNIRIENQSGQDIENFWLGAGPEGGSTEDTSFGFLKNGTKSDYYSIENIKHNYRKANFVIQGERQSVSDITDTLESGASYTFVLFNSPGGYAITLTKDK